MAKIRLARQGMLGQLLLGTDRPAQPVAYTVPLQPGIARTPVKSGPQIGSRSPQPRIPFLENSPYRSDCTLITTSWDDGLHPTGYKPMPATYVGPEDTWIAYFLNSMYATGGPFSRGVMRIQGYNPFPNRGQYYLTGVCSNSSETHIIPPVGYFSIVYDMSDEAVHLFSIGSDHVTPGCLTVHDVDPGTSIIGIQYYLFI